MLKKSIKNILLVDNHNLILDNLKTIMEEEGYTVYVASTKDEAMDALYNQAPSVNLIVSDVNLEEKNKGLRLSNIVLMNDKELPVVILTMNDDPLLVLSTLAIGVRGYLLKDNCDVDIFEAIKQIEQGKGFLSLRVKEKLRDYSNYQKAKLALSTDLIKDFEVS